MKELFPEFYDDPDFKAIWEEAIFVFDACSLVNVYWYAPESSNHFLSILKRLSDEGRLWMPYQFAHEYHRLLPSIRTQIEKDYQPEKKSLGKLCDFGSIIERLKEFKSRSGYSVEAALFEAIEDAFPEELQAATENVVGEFSEFERAHLDRLDNAGLKERVAEIFADACQKNPYSRTQSWKKYTAMVNCVMHVETFHRFLQKT